MQNLSAESKSEHLVFNGQADVWLTTNFRHPPVFQPGFRFVPEITGKFELKNQHIVDYEASMHLNGHVTFSNNLITDTLFRLKPYRIWARYASDNAECRVGLQKINFGSAKMFRPLMWFDAMDIRDPLQLTDGVYASLFKYFFENNASIWLWGMMGNQNPKGFESFGSQKFVPEGGGMFEFPAGPGEMGVAAHFRKINLARNHFENQLIFPYNGDLSNVSITESRWGFHGKWDLGIGLWFESSISRYSENLFIPQWSDMWNIGADYTFGTGNGLGVSVEYFRVHSGNEFLVNGLDVNVLGTMINYPLSINDQLSAMIFVLPDNSNIYNYFSWNKTIDNIVFNVILYWNPENAVLPVYQSSAKNLYNGKGIQCLLSYHF